MLQTATRLTSLAVLPVNQVIERCAANGHREKGDEESDVEATTADGAITFIEETHRLFLRDNFEFFGQQFDK